MGFVVSASSSSSIPIIESGTYPAVCIAIYDIGEQFNEKFGNVTRKCIIQYEIPSEEVLIDGEMKPRVISETYTASLNEKSNLRKVLESWRGRQLTQEELNGFDLENVLGKPCLLNIIHAENSKGNTFAKIASISRLPKAFSVATGTPTTLFSFDDDDALDKIENFPDWLKERCKNSETYKRALVKDARLEEPCNPDDFCEIEDSDLPF